MPVWRIVLRYKDIHAFDNNKTMKIIYRIYRAGEVSVHRACCERATQPYTLRGGSTIYPGSRPAGVTTLCPRMVTEYLLTRSMLIKMYKFTISGYVPVYVHCIYSQAISCRRSLSLFSLWFCLTLSERVSMSNMFWWDLKSSESKESFKFHSPYSLLICSISACSQHQYLLSWLNLFSCVYHLTCRKKEQKKEKKRKKEPFFSNRELLTTRKHWTIIQALHKHIIGTSHLFIFNSKYPHLSGNVAQKKIHCIQ